LGVGLLLAGVLWRIIFAGVGGFLVMLACAMWALTSWRHMGGIVSGKGAGVVARPPGAGRPQRQARGSRRPRGRRAASRGRRGKSGLSFMERLQGRRRRRQEGGR